MSKAALSRLCGSLNNSKLLICRNYTYKSIYNVDNLYPTSSLSQPSTFTTFVDDNFVGEIPKGKLKFKYSRSSGKGGQHVNKTESKVEARFNVLEADWLPSATKTAITEQYYKKVSKEGELIVWSDQSRYQLQNMKNCIDEIKGIIEDVQKPPNTSKEDEMEKLLSSEKLQIASKKRLRRKRAQSFTKSMRNDFS